MRPLVSSLLPSLLLTIWQSLVMPIMLYMRALSAPFCIHSTAASRNTLLCMPSLHVSANFGRESPSPIRNHRWLVHREVPVCTVCWMLSTSLVRC